LSVHSQIICLLRGLAPRRHWQAFAAAALAIGTLLSFTQYDGFTRLGGNLIANGDFSAGLDHWRWRGRPDAAGATVKRNTADAPAYVEISNRDTARSANLWQIVAEPGRFRHVSLAFELLLEDVAAGRKPEHQARIILASYDADGNGLWYQPHIFVTEDGSHGWKRYRRAFAVGRDVHEMHVIVQLNRATGLMRLRGLTLHGAEARLDWLILKGLLIALWALLGIALARNLLGVRPGRRWGMIALAVAAVFLLGTLSPKQIQTAAEDGIVALFSPGQAPAEKPPPAEKPEAQAPAPAAAAERPAQPPDFELLRPGKFAHLLLFALFGAALALRRARAAPGYLPAALALAAVCGEVLQFFALGRTPALQDIAINALGAFAGAAAMLLAIRFAWRRAKL